MCSQEMQIDTPTPPTQPVEADPFLGSLDDALDKMSSATDRDEIRRLVNVALREIGKAAKEIEVEKLQLAKREEDLERRAKADPIFEPTKTACEEFDELMSWTDRSVTEDRMPKYGHPLDNFNRADVLCLIVQECRHPAIRQALRMIMTKAARLCHNPKHLDTVYDIGGYARTICMIIDEEARRGDQKREGG